MKLAVIIPALNEEGSIGAVVQGFAAAMRGFSLPGLRGALTGQIFVADNGSTDRTAEVAAAAGAAVIPASRRGYGTACLAAMAALPPDTDIVVFADGDGADDPADLPALLAPILLEGVAFCVGSRTLGEQLGFVEPAALTGPQRFGNWLACTLLRLSFGKHFTDLGPFRAIRSDALAALQMDDPDFGWTVQMQARAARRGLRFREVPVRYRRRKTGNSKVSGNLKGSVMAGSVILRTLAVESVRGRRLARRLSPHVVAPGHAIPAPGEGEAKKDGIDA